MVKMESISKNDDQNWSSKSYFEIPPYGKSMCTISPNFLFWAKILPIK